MLADMEVLLLASKLTLLTTNTADTANASSMAPSAAALARLGTADVHVTVHEGERGWGGLESLEEEQAEQEDDRPLERASEAQREEGQGRACVKHATRIVDATESMGQLVRRAEHDSMQYPPPGRHRGDRVPVVEVGAGSSAHATGNAINGRAVSRTLSMRAQGEWGAEAGATVVGNCFGCAGHASHVWQPQRHREASNGGDARDGGDDDARLAATPAALHAADRAATQAGTHAADSCGRGAAVPPLAAEADALITSQVDGYVTCSLAGRRYVASYVALQDV